MQNYFIGEKSHIQRMVFSQVPAARRGIAFLLLVLVNASPLQVVLALEPGTTIDNPQLFTDQSGAPRADQTAGALIERVALNLPPGRNGLTPDLALVYNSQDLTDGIVGYGWSLSIPYIERINKTGSENLYIDNYFSSSLGGELATTTTANEYRHRFEDGRFLKFTYASNAWTAYDKNGTRYKFGSTTDAQQSATTSPSNVFRWMLEEVRDTNDNFIRYVYTKDGNQIYPSQIVYTGNGSTDGVFTIDITKSARPDKVISYKSAFKVTTDYRITEIKASVNGSWVRKYTLSYVSGANGLRSMLGSVQETGRDDAGVELSLPAQTFAYSSSTPTYESHTNPRIWNSSRIAADVDGNGLPDRSVFYSYSVSTYRAIDENEYPNFNLSSSEVSTEYWTQENGGVEANEFPPIERGTRLFDANGDGKADIFRSFKSGSTYTRDYRENQTVSPFTWTSFTATGTLPTFGCFDGVSSTYSTGLFGNLNGDGLVDYIASIPFCSVNGAYINAGTTTGWTASSTIFAAVANLPTSVSDTSQSELVDINGDGLDDWMHSTGGQTKFYLNTGTGWPTYEPLFTIATSTRHANGWDRGIRFFDYNGDGLPDYVRSYAVDNYTSNTVPHIEKGVFNYVYLNTGSGWATTTLSLPEYIFTGVLDAGSWRGTINYSEAVDWNGDGIPDFAGYTSTSTATAKADVLTVVTYPGSGTKEIEYKLSSQLASANPDLAFPVLVMTKVTMRDGVGSPDVTTYAYEGGKMYFSSGVRDRRFATFKTITKTDALGSTKTYYNQGDGVDTASGEQTDSFFQIGRAYREEVIPLSTTTPLRTTFTKWNTFNQATGTRAFVYREGEMVQHYDGDADHRDVATEYTYATSTGNLTQKVDRGEVLGVSDGTYADTSSDTRFTTYTYGTTTPTNLSPLMSTILKNNASTTIQHTRFYYDNQPFGSTTKGNLTKEENWISGSTFASSTKAYNSYGLVATATDPRVKTTTFTFDPYNMYVGTSTNPLSQTTGYVYNYAIGKARQVTDANSRTTKFVFDPVGRLKEKNSPDPASGVISSSTLFTYTDNVFPRKVQETRYLNSGTSTDMYTYFDGLGRLAQERAESDGTYVAKDKIYGSRGLLAQESLPYFSSGTAWTSAITSGPLLVSYDYDALSRVATITNALGNETHAFDQWTETITDREGHPKGLTSDAYGNLATVTEYLSGSPTTTSYTYDALNNLTKVTDALGNIRNFLYDGLSRATSSEDLHAIGDTSFGSTTYAYDLAGNMATRTDAKSQVVAWTYDSINRVLTENYTGTAGTEVTYTYDSCTNGVGGLCIASSSDAKITNTYDTLGRVKISTTTVSGVSYVTTQNVDRQGNISDITYPNSSQVKYIYDAAGMLDSVWRKAPGGSFSSLVSNLDYGPTGAVTLKKLGSGATTTFTYDADALYRLTRLATFGALASATSSGSTTPAITAPSHHWKLDESSGTAADAVGGMSLTNNNSTAFAPGKINNGADHETSNSNFFNTSTNIHGSTLTAFTASLWVKLESQPGTNGTMYLFSSVDTPGKLSVSYLDDAGTKKLRFFITDSTDGTANLFYNTTLSTGTWYHIVAQWTGTALKLYLNGADTGGSTSVSSIYAGQTDGTFIGSAWPSPGGQYFDGVVDEVSFWPSALTPTDISNLYNGGSGRAYPFDASTSTATTTLYTMLQDMNYTYDDVGNITQLFDTSSTTAQKTVLFEYDDLYRLTQASTTFATSTWYKRGFAYDALGNMTQEGTTTVSLSGFISTSPTHYWKLDESSGTAADAVGALTLTNNNSTAFAAGIINNGEDNERSNSSYFSTTSDLHGSTLAAFTISLWFKPESQPGTNQDMYLFGSADTPGKMAVIYSDSSGTKRIRFYITNSTDGTVNLFYDTTLSSGTWYHIVAQWTGTELKLYVNGVDSGQSTSVSSIYAGQSDGTFIGSAWPAPGGGYADGVIDELGFWPSALSAQDITDLYNSGVGVQYGGSSAGSTYDNRVYTYAGTGYLNPHAVSSIGNGLATTTYSYDNNGNLTSAGNRSFAWTYNNLLTQVSGTGTSTYWYDHAGQRVLQIGGGATTTYPSRFFSVATSTNGKGTSTEYIYAGNELVATIEGTSTASAVTRYMHPDHLGSTNVVSDQSMNAVQTLDYYPYGGTRIDSGTDVSQREFIGQFYDEQNSLSYLNARYYEPARGQFLSQDPVHLAIGTPAVESLTGQSQKAVLSDPQLLNSYSYAKNNPIRFKDPDGKYIEVSTSATVPGRSFSLGLRFDGGGVDFFMSGGVGVGLQGGLGLAWAPGKQLLHQREVSLTGSGSASAFVGLKVSQDLASYYPDARNIEPFSPADVAYTLGASGGVGVSLDEEFTKPLFTWGNKPNPGNKNTSVLTNNRSFTRNVQSFIQQRASNAQQTLSSLRSQLLGALGQLKELQSSNTPTGAQKKP
jgi:RHS repeat-associated protein